MAHWFQKHSGYQYSTTIVQRSLQRNSRIGQQHYVWCFSSFACVSALTKLRSQNYIKLSGDGTFKRTFQNWCIIPIGVLSKREGPTRVRGQDAPVKIWPTHFTPLGDGGCVQIRVSRLEPGCEVCLRDRSNVGRAPISRGPRGYSRSSQA